MSIFYLYFTRQCHASVLNVRGTFEHDVTLCKLTRERRDLTGGTSARQTNVRKRPAEPNAVIRFENPPPSKSLPTWRRGARRLTRVKCRFRKTKKWLSDEHIIRSNTFITLFVRRVPYNKCNNGSISWDSNWKITLYAVFQRISLDYNNTKRMFLSTDQS